MAKQISYSVRDFQNLRKQLETFVKSYYPDLAQNFNDAAVLSVLMDLNAAVTDNLHFHIDRSLQETVLQFAQQKSSIFNIARTYGLKIPGKRPSVAVVEFSITVPTSSVSGSAADKEDLRYCGILRSGSQVVGAGQIFETPYDINFASPTDNQGNPNRLVIPNFDVNDSLINYTIVKREVVVNGITKVFKKPITNLESRPFYELFLPENNVLGVTSVLLKDGLNYTNVPTPQEFLSENNRWYEVNALAEDRIFVEDSTKPVDKAGIKVGKYIQTANRFITEYTPEGYFKLTFGGGNTSTEEILIDFARNGTPLDLGKYQNNYSLGSVLTPTTTLFVQYRIGGGLATNVGANVINQIGAIDFVVNGPNENINLQVVTSIQCNNVTAAVGGGDYPTTEEVRNLVGFNFAAQNRAVTVNDYEALIRKMPAQFGAPAKVAITEEDNKIKINILSYDTQGKLTSVVSNTLKSNIATYLSNYRMINDYILVQSAEVIDLGVNVFVSLIPSQNQSSVVAQVINVTAAFLDPKSRFLGQNVNVSELKSNLYQIDGVQSVTDVQFFNKIGGKYSSSQTSQQYSNFDTKEIRLVNETIFAETTQVYQVRYPQSDITVQVQNLSTTNFS
jgi:hypothetical protein